MSQVVDFDKIVSKAIKENISVNEDRTSNEVTSILNEMSSVLELLNESSVETNSSLTSIVDALRDVRSDIQKLLSSENSIDSLKERLEELSEAEEKIIRSVKSITRSLPDNEKKRVEESGYLLPTGRVVKEKLSDRSGSVKDSSLEKLNMLNQISLMKDSDKSPYSEAFVKNLERKTSIRSNAEVLRQDFEFDYKKYKSSVPEVAEDSKWKRILEKNNSPLVNALAKTEGGGIKSTVESIDSDKIAYAKIDPQIAGEETDSDNIESIDDTLKNILSILKEYTRKDLLHDAEYAGDKENDSNTNFVVVNGEGGKDEEFEEGGSWFNFQDIPSFFKKGKPVNLKSMSAWLKNLRISKNWGRAISRASRFMGKSLGPAATVAAIGYEGYQYYKNYSENKDEAEEGQIANAKLQDPTKRMFGLTKGEYTASGKNNRDNLITGLTNFGISTSGGLFGKDGFRDTDAFAQYLTTLRKFESEGGDVLDLNKLNSEKALGNYQFLPSTLENLHLYSTNSNGEKQYMYRLTDGKGNYYDDKGRILKKGQDYIYKNTSGSLKKYSFKGKDGKTVRSLTAEKVTALKQGGTNLIKNSDDIEKLGKTNKMIFDGTKYITLNEFLRNNSLQDALMYMHTRSNLEALQHKNVKGEKKNDEGMIVSTNFSAKELGAELGMDIHSMLSNAHYSGSGNFKNLLIGLHALRTGNKYNLEGWEEGYNKASRPLNGTDFIDALSYANSPDNFVNMIVHGSGNTFDSKLLTHETRPYYQVVEDFIKKGESEKLYEGLKGRLSGYTNEQLNYIQRAIVANETMYRNSYGDVRMSNEVQKTIIDMISRMIKEGEGVNLTNEQAMTLSRRINMERYNSDYSDKVKADSRVYLGKVLEGDNSNYKLSKSIVNTMTVDDINKIVSGNKEFVESIGKLRPAMMETSNRKDLNPLSNSEFASFLLKSYMSGNLGEFEKYRVAIEKQFNGLLAEAPAKMNSNIYTPANFKSIEVYRELLAKSDSSDLNKMLLKTAPQTTSNIGASHQMMELMEQLENVKALYGIPGYSVERAESIAAAMANAQKVEEGKNEDISSQNQTGNNTVNTVNITNITNNSTDYNRNGI